MTAPEFIARHLDESTDLGFVYDAWTRGAHEVEPAKYVPWDLFRLRQGQHINRCRSLGQTLVLCHSLDPAQLEGFICYGQQAGAFLLHWLYVKSMFRRQGVASRLMTQVCPDWRERPVMVTQWSRGLKLLRERFTNFTLDPYWVGETGITL